MFNTRHLGAVLVCLALAVPASAQEQRGSIEGVVRDSSGAVMPGATVEARSPALVGIASAVTDTEGVYRFPALPPGTYEITVPNPHYSLFEVRIWRRRAERTSHVPCVVQRL
jgi:protocatechuate 3,4-dioxygenase beta subunit